MIYLLYAILVALTAWVLYNVLSFASENKWAVREYGPLSRAPWNWRVPVGPFLYNRWYVAREIALMQFPSPAGRERDPEES